MAYTAIDNPELYFQAKIYTGDGSTPSITLDGDTDMQPDLVWIKNRDQTDSHCLFDAVRGAAEVLASDSNAAETTDADTLTSFDSDGFALGADVKVNTDTEAYVAWCWKANGSGSSNEDGSINTTKTSANTTSGFSINTFTGSGSAATIGHGLGAVPRMIISKDYGGSNSWYVYHASLGNTHAMRFDTNDAKDDSTGYWNDTTPTSSVYTVGDNSGTNDTDTMLSYVFADVQGFSKFGGYTGNGNADGTFVYTGFKPAYFLTKRLNSAQSWVLFDNKRNPSNLTDNIIFTYLNSAEQVDTTPNIDLLSNGIKIRHSDDSINGSEPYIYMAFAEAPFVNSNGVPCNAR